MRLLTAWLCLALSPAWAADFAQLEGHGGPVKGVAISPDGSSALTASFDYAAGHWRLGEDEGEPLWLDGHEAAVNAVLFLPGNRAATAGDDFTIRIWDLATGKARHVLEGHQGKILSLALSPDGTIASAGWDGWIGLWDPVTGTRLRWLKGHEGYVNDVAFSQDGAKLYSASNDGTIRRWDVATGKEEQIEVRHGFGVNTLVLNEAAGWLAYGALDGGTRAIDLATGAVLADLTLDRRPILAMALRPDGGQIAVGDGEGFIMIVDTDDWSIARDFHAAKRGPVWALAYDADGERVMAGGIDDTAYLWPLEGRVPVLIGEGERSFLTDPDEMDNGARQFYRKCSICHTLTPDTARRAGPSLYGVFGRQAGTLDGYPYSEAMRGIGIVWDDETIDRLFEEGPEHYTPGSKMPMQRIAAPEDRAALIAFLRRMTGDTANGERN